MNLYDKSQSFSITVDIEFYIENCTLSSSELLDECPDIPYNFLDRAIDDCISTYFPNIGKHLAHESTAVIYDYNTRNSSMSGYGYSYTIQVIMTIETQDNKTLNLLELKHPKEFDNTDICERYMY